MWPPRAATDVQARFRGLSQNRTTFRHQSPLPRECLSTPTEGLGMRQVVRSARRDKAFAQELNQPSSQKRLVNLRHRYGNHDRVSPIRRAPREKRPSTRPLFLTMPWRTLKRPDPLAPGLGSHIVKTELYPADHLLRG